jgi:phage-related protein
MYGGTKSEMERLLADATKLTGVKYDINNLADVYDAIHAVQEELGVTGTTAKESAETLSGSLASMKGAFSNFLGKLALGEDITPSLEALAETVSTFLFGNFLPMIGNILKALPGALVTFIQAAAPHFIQAGKNFISSLGGGVSGGIPSLIASAGEAVNNFIAFLMENLPGILVAGKDMLLSLVNGIIENLPAIIESVIIIIGKLIFTIIANLPKILVTGAKILLELVAGIISVLPRLLVMAVTLMAKLVATIISKLPDVLKAGVRILGSIVSGIGQVASNLYSKGAELIRGLIGKITEKYGELKEKGRTIVTNITSGISSKITAAKTAINSVIQAVKDKIAGWMTSFKSAGSNIVSSIASGIRGAIGKVKTAINNVVQAIRNRLPFSPAKEGPLKDLHRLNFGGTISESIANARKPVAKAMESLGREVSDFDIGIPLNMGKPDLAVAGAEAVLPISKLSIILADTLNKAGYSKETQTPSQTNVTYNIEINNPVPEKSDDSVRKTLLKQSYGLGGA